MNTQHTYSTNILKLIFSITITLLLSACVSKPHITPGEGRSASKLEYWKAKGKLNVKYDGESTNAYFTWEAKGQDFDIRLNGPFGMRSMYISRQDGIYTLKNGEGEAQAESPEALMQSTLGWALPVSDLEYWIRGLRAPGTDAYTILPSTTIQQKGWVINYPRRSIKRGYLLPDKIFARHDQLNIKMVIKSWKVK